jgi:hypothetical protein
MATDTVCLSTNTDSCVSNFGFFLINSETGLQSLSGILGLSPSDKANGPSFMKALKDQGQIAEEIVSFGLNLYPTPSVA